MCRLGKLVRMDAIHSSGYHRRSPIHKVVIVIRYCMFALLAVAACWAGFAVPFFMFLVTGLNLLLLHVLSLALLGGIVLMRRHLASEAGRAWLLVPVAAAAVGILLQLAYVLCGGWSRFGS